MPEKADVPAIAFQMPLHQQSGTTRVLKLFACDVKKIADSQPRPEYFLSIGRDGRHKLVTLFRDPTRPGREKRGFRPVVITREI